MKRLNKNENLKSKMQAIIIPCLAIICIAVFTCGYYFSNHFIVKQVTDNEFKLYEQVAYDVCNQFGKSALYEIPEGVTVEKDDTSIVISSNDSIKYGKVIAKIQDGNLVLERDLEVNERADVNTFIGIIFAFVFLFIAKKLFN